MQFDAVVLGGGPAGSAAAIELARGGRSVAILERAHAARERIGETLPPAARVPLARLGVWERFVASGHAPSVGTLSAWGGPDPYETHFILNPYGHGWHIERAAFEAMLTASAEQAGARMYRGARVTGCDMERQTAGCGSWRVKVELDGRSEALTAPLLLDATGRACFIARKLGIERVTYDRLVGLAGFFHASDGTPVADRDNRTLLEAAEDGWWYSAWLPRSRLIAIWMTDADLYPRGGRQVLQHWESKLARTTHTRARVSGLAREQGLRTVGANSYRLGRVVGENWVSVGDAAGAIDPLSSQGIYNALESGLRAAQAVKCREGGDPAGLQEYAAWIEQRYEHYLRLRANYYEREERWPDSPFWKRRQGSGGAGSDERSS